MVDIFEAYKAYKAGKTVIIHSKEAYRKSREGDRYHDQPIPQGVHFRHYVDNYQYWTNTRPTFEVVGEC